MHVSHSLVPYAIGRYASRHSGLLLSGNQRQKSSTSLSNSGDILDERVYEGELVGRSGSFHTASSDSIYRCFTQQAYQSQAGEAPFLSRSDAIRAYINNAEFAGINRTACENSLDIYV